MIYLDVTSACQSPLNTGVKRMQRGLHELLRSRHDYQPVCWQWARRTYRSLRAEDRARLEQVGAAPGASLYDSFLPGLVPDLRNYGADRDLALDLKKASERDVLLLPDLLWDNRGAWLAGGNGSGPRRVAFFHDAIGLRLPAQSRLDRFFCARGVRALAHAHLVLAISREAENDLRHYGRQFGCTMPPIRFLPWPVPFHGPQPRSESSFAARKILYVARLEEHKNHLRLLDACETLWREGLRFQLRLIGCKAYPSFTGKVLRRVRALQRRGHDLSWQAHVSEEELHAAYRSSSFTVFPSLLEGFGLPILESLWHGRPVVCGREGAIGETAQGGGCVFADPRSAADLARAQRELLTDPNRYDSLRAEIQARSFRDWAQYGRELDEALAIAL